MKYLNEESQFTRVSDEHARAMMESIGYALPEATNVVNEIYVSDDREFALLETVVEAEDGYLYVQLEEVTNTHVVQVDESGRKTLVEAVSFEEEEFVLEGLFNDEEGLTWARMVSENVEDPEASEESEEDEE